MADPLSHRPGKLNLDLNTVAQENVVTPTPDLCQPYDAPKREIRAIRILPGLSSLSSLGTTYGAHSVYRRTYPP